MSVDLKVDSKTSLFEPVEIEVDGVTLRVRTQTLKTLKMIQKLWTDMQAGSAEAISAGLGALFDGDVSVLDELPLTELTKVIEFAIKKSVTPEKDAKNPSGPGDKSLPS